MPPSGVSLTQELRLSPLELLRLYTVEGRLSEVKEQSGRVYFGGRLSYDNEVQTPLKVAGSDTGYYTLFSLLHFLRSKSEPHAAYIKGAMLAFGARHIPVKKKDRNEVEKYLTGVSVHVTILSNKSHRDLNPGLLGDGRTEVEKTAHSTPANINQFNQRRPKEYHEPVAPRNTATFGQQNQQYQEQSRLQRSWPQHSVDQSQQHSRVESQQHSRVQGRQIPSDQRQQYRDQLWSKEFPAQRRDPSQQHNPLTEQRPYQESSYLRSTREYHPPSYQQPQTRPRNASIERRQQLATQSTATEGPPLFDAYAQVPSAASALPSNHRHAAGQKPTSTATQEQEEKDMFDAYSLKPSSYLGRSEKPKPPPSRSATISKQSLVATTSEQIPFPLPKPVDTASQPIQFTKPMRTTPAEEKAFPLPKPVSMPAQPSYEADLVPRVRLDQTVSTVKSFESAFSSEQFKPAANSWDKYDWPVPVASSSVEGSGDFRMQDKVDRSSRPTAHTSYGPRGISESHSDSSRHRRSPVTSGGFESRSEEERRLEYLHGEEERFRRELEEERFHRESEDARRKEEQLQREAEDSRRKEDRHRAVEKHEELIRRERRRQMEDRFRDEEQSKRERVREKDMREYERKKELERQFMDRQKRKDLSKPGNVNETNDDGDFKPRKGPNKPAMYPKADDPPVPISFPQPIRAAMIQPLMDQAPTIDAVTAEQERFVASLNRRSAERPRSPSPTRLGLDSALTRRRADHSHSPNSRIPGRSHSPNRRLPGRSHSPTVRRKDRSPNGRRPDYSRSPSGVRFRRSRSPAARRQSPQHYTGEHLSRGVDREAPSNRDRPKEKSGSGEAFAMRGLQDQSVDRGLHMLSYDRPLREPFEEELLRQKYQERRDYKLESVKEPRLAQDHFLGDNKRSRSSHQLAVDSPLPSGPSRDMYGIGSGGENIDARHEEREANAPFQDSRHLKPGACASIASQEHHEPTMHSFSDPVPAQAGTMQGWNAPLPLPVPAGNSNMLMQTNYASFDDQPDSSRNLGQPEPTANTAMNQPDSEQMTPTHQLQPNPLFKVPEYDSAQDQSLLSGTLSGVAPPEDVQVPLATLLSSQDDVIPKRYRLIGVDQNRCHVCGSKKHGASENCPLWRRFIEAQGPNYAEWTKKQCLYPPCKDPTMHRVRMCPSLHSYCRGGCGKRGHLPMNCFDRSVDAWRDLYDQFSPQGHNTRFAAIFQDWGFQGPQDELVQVYRDQQGPRVVTKTALSGRPSATYSDEELVALAAKEMSSHGPERTDVMEVNPDLLEILRSGRSVSPPWRMTPSDGCPSQITRRRRSPDETKSRRRQRTKSRSPHKRDKRSSQGRERIRTRREYPRSERKSRSPRKRRRQSGERMGSLERATRGGRRSPRSDPKSRSPHKRERPSRDQRSSSDKFGKRSNPIGDRKSSPKRRRSRSPDKKKTTASPSRLQRRSRSHDKMEAPPKRSDDSVFSMTNYLNQQYLCAPTNEDHALEEELPRRYRCFGLPETEFCRYCGVSLYDWQNGVRIGRKHDVCEPLRKELKSRSVNVKHVSTDFEEMHYYLRDPKMSKKRCKYPPCLDPSTHLTSACPQLHALCRSDLGGCGCRGHPPTDCREKPKEEWRNLYKEYHKKGMLTQRADEFLDWQFEGPKGNLVEVPLPGTYERRFIVIDALQGKSFDTYSPQELENIIHVELDAKGPRVMGATNSRDGNKSPPNSKQPIKRDHREKRSSLHDSHPQLISENTDVDSMGTVEFALRRNKDSSKRPLLPDRFMENPLNEREVFLIDRDGTCGYPLCLKPSLHATRVCPYLHRLCWGANGCGRRGHAAGNCFSGGDDKRDIFEQFAGQGLKTQRALNDPDWGFDGPSFGLEQLVLCKRREGEPAAFVPSEVRWNVEGSQSEEDAEDILNRELLR